MSTLALPVTQSPKCEKRGRGGPGKSERVTTVARRRVTPAGGQVAQAVTAGGGVARTGRGARGGAAR